MAGLGRDLREEESATVKTLGKSPPGRKKSNAEVLGWEHRSSHEAEAGASVPGGK